MKQRMLLKPSLLLVFRAFFVCLVFLYGSAIVKTTNVEAQAQQPKQPQRDGGAGAKLQGPNNKDPARVDQQQVDQQQLGEAERESQDWQTIGKAALEKRQLGLLAKLSPGSALIVAAAPSKSKDYLGYRQEPNYLYLTGSRYAGGLLVLVKVDEERRLRRLYLPRRNTMTELWEGRRPTYPQAKARDFGNAELCGEERLVSDLKGLEKVLRKIFLVAVSESRLKELGVTFSDSEKLANGDLLLARARVVKDSVELGLIQRAVDMTGVAHCLAMQNLGVNRPEFQLQALIEMAFRYYGASRPAFASIIGSGPNSCVLHYSANNRVMLSGDLVVVDIGAKYRGYCADLTRTLPVNGRFSPRQREIYELVLEAQQAAFKLVKPGSDLRAVHGAAAKVFEEAGYRKYFPHGTSHWLGLETHDVVRISRLTKLKKGMVFTVEPGLYVFEEDLGVRIEDVVVVTEQGYRCLSDGIPRTVAAIEKACRLRTFGKLTLPKLEETRQGNKGSKSP